MLTNVLDWIVRNQTEIFGAFWLILLALIFGPKFFRLQLLPLFPPSAPLLNEFAFYRATYRTGGCVPLLLITAALIAIVISISGGEVLPKTIVLANPPKLCGRDSAHTAVVFIHGWTGDATASWNPMSEFACQDDRLSAVDIYMERITRLLSAGAICILRDYHHGC